MAAPGCVFQRTLGRYSQLPQQVVCRDVLVVAALQRYSRDQGAPVYFPQAVFRGLDLYDLTLTDGDCRLQVTLDPGLNALVARHGLRPGSRLRRSTLARAMSAQPPGHPGSSGASFTLLTAEVMEDDEEAEAAAALRCPDVQNLPWFGSSEAGELLPLRACRSAFLPLWNNVDYSGEQWREAPPPEEGAGPQPWPGPSSGARLRPGITVAELRDPTLAQFPNLIRGAVRRRLIVRVVNKSHLMYFGRGEQNCDCPYKAELEVCDPTGSITVVLWNSVCFHWYRCLKPGDLISLSCFRLKRQYLAEPEDVEISVNSRNPTALMALLAPSSLAPQNLPPPASYCFHSSQELLDLPHGAVCDVIGLVTFLGRSERVRSRDCQGAELLEYRWLQLEDGTSERPIRVKLFPTSQPDTHQKLHPLAVVVCSRVKLLRGADGGARLFYLTNTTHTQVYCSGLGQHPAMEYRRLRPVKRCLQWVKDLDDGPVLGRALVGGFFTFPAPPVSLETYMRGCRGEPGFLRGLELQRELDLLCYRERRSFCVQAAVTMVTYSLRGQEDRCLFWTHQPPPSCSASSAYPISAWSAVTQRPQHRRKLPQGSSSRAPSVTEQPDLRSTAILFGTSLEFLQRSDEEEPEEDEDEDAFAVAPQPPAFTPIAMETLPLRYDHNQREEQAAAVALGGRVPATFDPLFQDYYTFRLRALTDGVLVDAVFLPHASGSAHQHPNSWASILSHGAFSADTPPPAPRDLICSATQLANQKLVCVLEACHLGGDKTEVILSRAFSL